MSIGITKGVGREKRDWKVRNSNKLKIYAAGGLLYSYEATCASHGNRVQPSLKNEGYQRGEALE